MTKWPIFMPHEYKNTQLAVGTLDYYERPHTFVNMWPRLYP